jgi:hypothetical protein
MSSVAGATSEKIVLNFAWEGPNTWHGGISSGGLDLLVVDLLFKEAKTQVSVHLPEKINPDTPRKFSFTCRKFLRQTKPDSLSVTVEQVRNLALKAGRFEKGKPCGPVVMDSSGRITQQQTLKRSDKDIKLEVPEELKPGKRYTLVVTSVDLALSARLVEEVVASLPA